MAVYFKKTWGWGEPVGPLIFSQPGARDRARQTLRPGDLVFIVATKGNETAEAQRGMVLGIMQPSTTPIMALDFPLPQKAEHFDDSGGYRWPYGLLNERAWTIAEPCLLAEITTRRIDRQGTLTIEPFEPEEARRALKLARIVAPLLEPTYAGRVRLHGLEAVIRRTSPVPTTTRVGIMHMRHFPAETYLMKIEGAKTEAYKIGWAFEYKLRARQFNKASMPQLGGLEYKPVLYQRWQTARHAYRMEQSMLQAFHDYRHRGNHEIISGVKFDDLQSAWIKLIKAQGR